MNTLRCRACRAELNQENIMTVGHRLYCQDCWPHMAYICEECGNIHHRTESYESQGRTLCEECYRKEHPRCSQCGRLRHHSTFVVVDGVKMCAYCFAHLAENDKRIWNYSRKPKARLHYTRLQRAIKDSMQANAPSWLLFGVENELSFDSVETRYKAISAFRSIFKNTESFYLKHDGSLSNGVETVSHPRTLESWQALKPKLEKAFEKLRGFTNGLQDGLHVHISKRGMTEIHKKRFESFIVANQDLIEKIARRLECHWCEYGARPTSGYHVMEKGDNYHRRKAVNWKNANTVELRIFNSTLDVNHYLASIEFCHAIYTFTKTRVNVYDCMQDKAPRMGGVFCDWVDHWHNDKYPHLAKFLTDNNLCYQ